MINQPSKEDGKRQVQNLTKAQFKISNTKQTRRRQEQRQQFEYPTLTTTNSGRQHRLAISLRSPTFTFQRIPTRALAKDPERQEGGKKSIKKQIEYSIIYAAISLGQRESPSPGDRDSIKHQTQGTNAINQNNNYLSEPGEVTWQKTEGR